MTDYALSSLLDNRELKHRRSWFTDGNRKSKVSFFGVVLLLTTDRKSSSWWLWLVVTNAITWKPSKKGKIQFPVAVCGWKTSVLKFPNTPVATSLKSDELFIFHVTLFRSQIFYDKYVISPTRFQVLPISFMSVHFHHFIISNVYTRLKKRYYVKDINCER